MVTMPVEDKKRCREIEPIGVPMPEKGSFANARRG
jgi:hypothetical protein